MKILVKDIPIYTRKLVFVLSDNPEEEAKKLNLVFDDDKKFFDCRGVAFFSTYKNRDAYFIFVRDRLVTPWDTIAHEVLHITNMIMSRAGVEASNTNDEAHCYLLGWIIHQIHIHIMKELLKEDE